MYTVYPSRSDPPFRGRAICVYICPPQKKIMTVTKIRPDIEDAIEDATKHSKEHILIVVEDSGVSFKSSLNDKNSVFYIELCKQLILEDWLCGNSTK